jgi:hypothetical protein
MFSDFLDSGVSALCIGSLIGRFWVEITGLQPVWPHNPENVCAIC